MLTIFDCLYKLIKDFQTLLVGVIGFSGVIITLLMNSRLSRKQHERIIKHDREVLKTALCAELELNRKSFSHKGSTLEDDQKESDSFHPIGMITNVYQAFIEKLGLLSTAEVSAVINAYTLIDEAPVRLGLLSSGHDPSYDKPGYIFIKASHSKTAAGIYNSALPSIQIALEKLSAPD